MKKLDVGEELDKLVAEKIFGLVPCDKWKKLSLGSAGGMTWTKQDGDCAHKACYPSDKVGNMMAPDGGIGGCPQYSKVPDLAVEIIEKVNFPIFESRRLGQGENVWCVDIFLDGDEKERIHSCGRTFPHAVCRGALAALEAIEKKEKK